MKPVRLAALAALLAFSLAAAPPPGAVLRAGVARVDITPPLGMHLQGYSAPGRTALGIRDPLYARVLVLAAGGERMALVDLDLIAPFGPAFTAALQTDTQDAVGGHLIVAAIHTHSGPGLIPTGGPAPADWEQTAVAKVAAAIHRAAASLAPVRVGAGYGVSYIGHNRLFRHRNGTVSWLEPDWTGAPTAPIDPTVAVLRIDDAGGAPLAVLVNYPCHAVIFGPDNRLYSADWPGEMTHYVNQAFGGHPLVFFLQGGDGDINPNFADTPLAEGAARLRVLTGDAIGRVVVRVARGIGTEAPAHPSLYFADDVMTFAPRWDRAKWLAADARQEFPSGNSAQQARRVVRQTPPAFHAHVITALLDRQIAFLTLPGEPFVELQRQWRAQCPVSDCLFLGYSNGYLGYLPTIRAASWGGYGAGNTATQLEVGAGKRMVEHGLIRIYEMLGDLSSTPEDLRP